MEIKLQKIKHKQRSKNVNKKLLTEDILYNVKTVTLNNESFDNF